MQDLPVRNLFDLTGKVAMVTGALGILGKPLCRALSDYGAAIAVVDQDEHACQRFADELRRAGGQAEAMACDVSDAAQVRDKVAQIVQCFGHLDIVLNHAASKTADRGQFLTSTERYTPETWREVMSVNLDGMFFVAQAAGSQMIRQGTGGSMIHTASIYGVVAPDERIYEGSFYEGQPIQTPAVYAASKAGVIGLTRYLAAQWAPHGIRVNTVSPGGMFSGQNDTFVSRYAQRVPLGRMGQPEELIGAYLYLASGASSYVTGHNLMVDGGMHIW